MAQQPLPLNEPPKPIPPRIRAYFERVYNGRWREAYERRAAEKPVPAEWRRR